MKACKFTGALAATLLGLGLAGAAHGGEGGEGLPKGVYVGASIGHGIFKIWDDDVDFCAASGGICRTGNEEIVYSVYGGFELSPHVAIEAGWVGHEALEVGYNRTCQDGSALRRELSAWSVYAAAVGRLPVDTGRIRPFGKAGMYWWKSEFEDTVCGVVTTTKDDDPAPLVGAGVDVELTERTSLRGEWIWFTESDGVHAFLGGLNFRF